MRYTKTYYCLSPWRQYHAFSTHEEREKVCATPGWVAVRTRSYDLRQAIRDRRIVIHDNAIASWYDGTKWPICRDTRRRKEKGTR